MHWKLARFNRNQGYLFESLKKKMKAPAKNIIWVKKLEQPLK